MTLTATSLTNQISDKTMKRNLLIPKDLLNSLGFWLKCKTLNLLSDLDMVTIISVGSHIDCMTHIVQRQRAALIVNNPYKKEKLEIVGIDDIDCKYTPTTMQDWVHSNPPTTCQDAEIRMIANVDTVNYKIKSGAQFEKIADGWYIINGGITHAFIDTHPHATFEEAAKILINRQHCHPSTYPSWVISNKDIVRQSESDKR